jgi:putative ABC transport system permease protein
MKTDNLVVLNTNFRTIIQKTSLETIKKEFQSLPGVLLAATSMSVPPNVSSVVQVKPAGSEDSAKTPWTSLSTNPDFLDAYRLQLVEGRFFSTEIGSDLKTAAVINETAARKLGPGSAIGKMIQSIYGPNGNFRDDLRIVGVVKDFHGRSLHYGIEPLIFRMLKGPGMFLTLHIRPENVSGTLKSVREAWTRLFPGLPFEYTFLDDTFREAYKSDAQFQGMIQAFTLIVLLIGCLGLFGLATYSIQRKKKEMGIRKILGASLGRLAALFFGEFARPVVLSNLIAWPIAYILARKWLQDFAYQTTIPFWVFLAGGALALAIAFLTVGARVIRAAAENPIEALRVE